MDRTAQARAALGVAVTVWGGVLVALWIALRIVGSAPGPALAIATGAAAVLGLGLIGTSVAAVDVRVVRLGLVVAASALVAVAALGAALPTPGLHPGWGPMNTVVVVLAVPVAIAAAAPGRLLRAPAGALSGISRRTRLWPDRDGPGPVEIALLVAVVLAFTVATVLIVRVPVAFGHDEAVYAVQARAWAVGGADTGIAPHRAPLVPLLAVPAVLAGATSEAALRLIGLPFGVATVIGAWLLARRLGGPAAGVLAAVVVGFSPLVLDITAMLMTDVPAAACLLWAVIALHHDLERRARRPDGPPPGAGLVAAGVLLAVAVHVRYGSALPAALIALTTVVVWWPQLRAHAARAGVAAAAFVVVISPHAIRAWAEFGAPWGLITYTSEAAGAERLGVGLQAYIAQLPEELAGRPVGLLAMLGIVVGAAWLLTSTVRGRWDGDARAWCLVLVPAVGHIVLLGTVAPPQPRFVIFGIVLLAIAGSWAVGWLLTAAASRAGMSTAIAAALLVGAVVFPAAWGGVSDVVDLRRQQVPGRLVLVEASAAVHERSNPDCGVLTSYVPHLTWYADCEAYEFDRADELATADRYLLLIERGKRPPDPTLAEQLRACVDDRPIATFPDRPGRLGTGELYAFRDDAPQPCPP